MVTMDLQSNRKRALNMSFGLTQEQLALREVAAEVARDVYAPVAAQWDAERTALPAAETKRLAEPRLPRHRPARAVRRARAATCSRRLLVVEELAKECRPAAFQVFEANVGPARVIEFFGTEAQREWILPKVVTGEITMAIGISEPDAGSAATDMRTTPRLEGDELVINGTKRWISNGGHADHYLVYCRLSDAPGAKGIGAVIVPADTPGLQRRSPREADGLAQHPLGRPLLRRRPGAGVQPGRRGRAVSASCSGSSRSNAWATRR